MPLHKTNKEYSRFYDSNGKSTKLTFSHCNIFIASVLYYTTSKTGWNYWK